MRYNHLFIVGFSVDSEHEDPDHITTVDLINAMAGRLQDLRGSAAACEAFDHTDTYEMPDEDLRYHDCDPSESWPESDARGIYLCRMCPKCQDAKLAIYRPEVLTDSQYEADEPIEPEDY